MFGLVLEVARVRAAVGDGRTCSPARSRSSATLFYVFVYTIWLKPRSPQNIVIGGAAGAVPVLVGWAAVTGELAAPAWVLFAIVFFWTPAALLGAALQYRDDYAAAGIPMLPGGEGHPGRGAPDRRVLVRRRRDDARAAAHDRRRRRGLRRRRRGARRRCSSCRRFGCARDTDAERGDHASSRSRTSTSRCSSPPLPSTPSSAPSDDARRRARRARWILVAHRGRRRRSRSAVVTSRWSSPAPTTTPRPAPRPSVAGRSRRRPTVGERGAGLRRSRRSTAGRCALSDLPRQAGRRELLGVVVHTRAARSSRCCARRRRSTGDDGSQVVGVTYQDLAVGRARVRRGPATPSWPLGVDGDGDGRPRRTACAALPQTFFIDADGTIAQPRHSGELEPARCSTSRARRRSRSRAEGAEPLTPPSGTSGRRRAARRPPTRRARRARRSGSVAPASSTPRTRLGQRRRGQQPWRRASSASGSWSSGYAMPPRNSSTRNSPLATARFASARSVPAMQHADAGERDRADEQQPDARRRARRSASQPSAMPGRR